MWRLWLGIFAMMEEEKEMTVEKLKVELNATRSKILALSDSLEAARVANIAAGETPHSPAWKAWKVLDEKDSALRLRASEIEDEISYLED